MYTVFTYKCMVLANPAHVPPIFHPLTPTLLPPLFSFQIITTQQPESLLFIPFYPFVPFCFCQPLACRPQSSYLYATMKRSGLIRRSMLLLVSNQTSSWRAGNMVHEPKKPHCWQQHFRARDLVENSRHERSEVVLRAYAFIQVIDDCCFSSTTDMVTISTLKHAW